MDPQLSLLRTGQEGNGTPFGNESNPDLKAVDTDLKIQPRDAVPASLPPDTVSKNASPNVALENASSHKHIPVESSRRKQAETVSQDHYEEAADVSSEKGRSEEPQQPSIKGWIGAGLFTLGKATVIRPKPTASAPVTALEPEIAETSNTEPSGEQNKAFGVDRAEAGAPKLPSLISLSYLPGSSGIDVVAVHDPGLSWKDAWIYAPEKSYARRPRDSTPRPANASQFCSSKGRLGPGTLFTPQNENVQGNKNMQHIESWKSEIEPAETPSGREKRGLEQATPLAIPGPGDNETPAASADRGNIAAAEKGKRRADTRESRESGRQSLAKEPFNSPKPEKASETKLNDDDMSHRSHSTTSIHKEVRQSSEKGKDSKDRTWLTDPTMLLGDLGEARVLAFTYSPLTQTQSTKGLLDKEGDGKYLEETANALLSQLKTQRKGDRSGTPLIFIATARGCRIVQKLITLIAEDAAMLAMIAAIIFDPGSTREEPETVLKLASDEVKDSQTSFYQVITKNELETVWFYSQQDTSRVNKPNRFDEYRAINFIKQEAIAKAGQPRFKNQWDSNYTRFRNEIRRCLVLWVSTKKEFEMLLAEFIDRNYNLDVRDYQQRSPIHRAVKCANYRAALRLMSAEPDLVVAQDNTLSTALHIAVQEAAASSQDRNPYNMIIETLVATFEEIQKDDGIKDQAGKSPWDYALGDECRWIHELALFNGAQVANSTAIDETKELPEKERIACESSRATLAQFYIAGDHKSDFLRLQTLDIYSTIYNKQDGIERSFDRKRIPTRNDDKLPTCRWIHLPANNEKWVHDLFARQLNRHDGSTSERRHQGSVSFDRYIFPDAATYKQPCKNSQGKKTVIALFMPIFGFETHGKLGKLSSAMKNPHRLTASDETSLLIRAYLQDEYPLHCRRTLDQFTYHTSDDTKQRDNDQVISKWVKREERKKAKKRVTENLTNENTKNADVYQQQNRQQPSTQPLEEKCYPVLMVDQLWLWILEDEKTVITSFPNTWEPTKNYNLVKDIKKLTLAKGGRQVIQNSLDLANLLIRCSVDCLSREGPKEAKIEQCFRSSITAIAQKQARQFSKFKRLVKILNKGRADEIERAKLTNQLFQLTTETRLLEQIIDIQDELKTIHEVFHKQKEALRTFSQQLWSGDPKTRTDNDTDGIGPPKPSTSVSLPSQSSNIGPPDSILGIDHPSAARNSDRNRGEPKTNVHFADEIDPRQKARIRAYAQENIDLVESNIATIKEMDTYAKRLEAEINGLLSHRQKQANAWEARFAREGAEFTRRQSNIILVFTVVTVFFLPLSLMSSIFAIQIDAYPHDKASGEVNWPLWQVIGLLVGISLGMILLIAFLGFNINPISRFFAKHFGRLHPQMELADTKQSYGPYLGLEDPISPSQRKGQHYYSTQDTDDSTSDSDESLAPAPAYEQRVKGNLGHPLFRTWLRLRRFMEGKILRPLARMAPASWRKKGVVGEKNITVPNSVRSGMRRSTAFGDGDDWDMSSQPSRRKRTRLRRRVASSGGPIPWDFQRPEYGDDHSMARVDVLEDPSRYGLSRSELESDDGEWTSGKKRPLIWTMRRILRGEKVKNEDVERGLA